MAAPRYLPRASPRTVLPFDSNTMPLASAPKLLPLRMTPAELASMVRLPCVMVGRGDWSLIIVGAVGGKTRASKVIVSPEPAAARQFLSDPTPERSEERRVGKEGRT